MLETLAVGLPGITEKTETPSVFCLNNFDPVENGANYWPQPGLPGVITRDTNQCRFGDFMPYQQHMTNKGGVRTYTCQNQAVQVGEGGYCTEISRPHVVHPSCPEDIGGKARAMARLTSHGRQEDFNCFFVVQCSSGAAWSAVFIMMRVILSRLLAGTEVEVLDLWHELRSVRPDAITQPDQYMVVYMSVLEYIKARVPEHKDRIDGFLADVKGAMEPPK
ncbi:unnamed protein product, partial [Mesorhabditis spiculigera]